MKTNFVSILALGVFSLTSLPTFSNSNLDRGMGAGIERIDRFERQQRAQNLNTDELDNVKWVGLIKDDASTHTELHEHKLQFVRLEDGKSYNLKFAEELIKLHHDNEKNYIVEIEAERKPKLFSKDVLEIQQFKIIREAGGQIPHNKHS